MPMMPNNITAQSMGNVASPSPTALLTMLVPIVPINDLFNVVSIRNKSKTGTNKHVYARKDFNHLGTDIGTRRFLCGKN